MDIKAPLWEGVLHLQDIILHCKTEQKTTYDVLGPYAAKYDVEFEVRALQDLLGIELFMEWYGSNTPSV